MPNWASGMAQTTGLGDVLSPADGKQGFSSLLYRLRHRPFPNRHSKVTMVS